MTPELDQVGGAGSTVRLVDDGRCRRSDCPHDGRVHELWMGDTLVVRGLCDGCITDMDRIEARLRRERTTATLLADGTSRMRSWSLSTYPGPQAAMRAASEWISDWRDGRRRGLVLHGPVGTGKTGLAWSLALELAQDGVDVAVRNWRDVLGQLKESYDGGMGPDLGRIRRCELLVLDDLGAERPTEWARDELAQLIDSRYGAERPMIVTSNYPLSELAVRLGHDDPTVGERIVSRIADGAMKVEVAGRDLRTSK